MAALYNCDACPAFCCGYPVIETTKRDISRLARHFEISPQEAKSRFTEQENNRVRKLKQRHDKKFNSPVCVFLNQKTRNCSIYAARPKICREHPGDRCEWHDRAQFEKIANGGKKVIRLKVLPWTIDGDYPLYGKNKLPALLAAYAKGSGKMPKKRKSG
jgi:Fe-S-cluster containining protein